MRTPTVVVASLCDEAFAREAVARVRGACAQWALDCRPKVEEWTIDRALFDREASEVSVDELLVLMVDGSCGASRLGRVCDRAAALGLTVAALVGDDAGKGTASGLESRGIVSAPVHVGPVEFSVTLRTLLASRPTNVRLLRELSRAREGAGGLLGQMHAWRQELSEAAGFQRELMPAELPRIDGVETAALFRPANHVSGDVFDACEISDGRLAMFVGDAVGHGVPAALLTVVMIMELERTLRAGEDDPAAVLAHVNEALCACQGETPRFATAVCAVLDPKSGALQIASAGHPAPMLMRGRASEAIDVGGPLLGVFPGAAYECERIAMGRGDTLVLHTDGFETAFGGDESEGRSVDTKAFEEHFSSIFGGACELGPDLNERVASLIELVDAQPGSLHQKDDLTVLAVGLRGASIGEGVASRIAA